MNRTTAFMGIMLTVLLLSAPLAMAQENQYGAVPGHPSTEADSEKCRAATEGTDTTCVILYGHLFDLLNKVPINVQRPPDWSQDLSRGFTGTPGYEPVWDFNQLKLESSPGFVEYDAKQPDKKPRLHPERGLSSDVLISQDTSIFGYWYLSADFDEASPAGVDRVPPPDGEDPSIGVMPCLTVRMVLQTGRFYGTGGDVIAEGQTTKNIVTGSALKGQENPGVPATPCPEGEGEAAIGDVVEFEVDLGKATGIIPEDKGFIVWVEWWLHNPSNDVDNPEKVYQHQWNLRTGSDYPARVVLPVENPVRIETVRPQFFDNKLYIHGVLNSPWGSYDVDTSSIKVEVLDESGAPVSVSNMADPVLRYSVDHDGHFKPVNVTYMWDYQKDNIAPGEYTIKMSAKNWQWTATAEKSGSVVIADDISKSSAEDSDGNRQIGDPSQIGKTEEGPGVSVITLALLGVALLGLGRIRRRA